MIVDFEHHYIPAELGRRLGMDPTRKEAVKTRDATVHAQLFDLEAQLRDLDRVGIDVAVQSCILGWDTTLENCRLINDCTAAAQQQYRGRFVGLAHAPILEEDGLRELERAIDELGLKGITISSQVNGLPLDAREFVTFYELMRRLRVPIFVHPALAPKGYSLMNDYQLPVILTREFDLGLAVTRLIAGGVIERYPELDFVFAHFGGGLAGYRERVARSARIASSYLSGSRITSIGFTSTWQGSKAVQSRCAARSRASAPKEWYLRPTIRRISITAIRNRARASMVLDCTSNKLRSCR